MSRDASVSTSASARIWTKSEGLFPGGVNSPVRAFHAVGGSPVVITAGRGARVWDADHREFLDYVGSWGALILGHAPAEVRNALLESVARGTGFGMLTPYEVELAQLIQEALPTLELMRFVSSGTEAAMSAIRVARGFTGRDKILKFAGCYHGHADAVLAEAGSGVATLGLPSSAGVPRAATADTFVVPYNDLPAVRQVFATYPEAIAAVIVEPVAANMGVILPRPGFLDGLREITTRDGALLIFDEVITGFRLAYGGAQTRYHVHPDLTCLGKIIGGGLPIGAYGGRRDVMATVAPLGPVYQAGTLAGNPLAVAAGTATLRCLADGTIYPRLDDLSRQLADGLASAAREAGIPVWVVSDASMLTVFFTAEPPADYVGAQGADRDRFARFFHGMLARGILLPPSQFEAWFVSAAHGLHDITETIEAARAVFRDMR